MALNYLINIITAWAISQFIVFSRPYIIDLADFHSLKVNTTIYRVSFKITQSQASREGSKSRQK